MACLNCKNIFSCGTINNYLVDLTKSELIKVLESEKEDCDDFQFDDVSECILKAKLKELITLSNERRKALKRALKGK